MIRNCKFIANSVTTIMMVLTVLTLFIFDCVLVSAMKIAVVGSGPASLQFLERTLRSQSSEAISLIDIYDYRSDPTVSNNPEYPFAIGMESSWLYLQEPEGLAAYLKDSACALSTKTFRTADWTKDPIEIPSNGRMTLQPMFCSAYLSWIKEKTMHQSSIKLSFNYNHKVLHADPSKGILTFSTPSEKLSSQTYDLIVGGDGATSVVRHCISSQHSVTCEKSFIPSMWKCIAIDCADLAGIKNFYRVDKIIGGVFWMPNNRTHILTFWNPTDGDSNTLNTLQNPATLQNEESIIKFLDRILLGKVDRQQLRDKAKEFYEVKPRFTSNFKMSKYYHESGKAVVLGDAAHSMSTAFGQGMACALQDANYLVKCLTEIEWDTGRVKSALKKYSELRVSEGNAITDVQDYLFMVNRFPFIFIMYDFIFFGGKGEKIRREILSNSDGSTKYSELLQRYRPLVAWGRRIRDNTRKRIETLLDKKPNT